MDRPAAFPTFFLVGAPRCGTTSLSRYLADHANICFSRPKEPHYLVQSPADIDDYVQTYTTLFFSHHAGETAVGEGSVSYLYKDEILHRILDLNPDARFIVNVRNPVQQLRSYHQRLLFLMDETVEDFRTAWDLQDDRADGRHVPDRCRDPRLLLYREVGRLGTRVERLFEIAGRDRVHVVVFDDFIGDTKRVYEDVCQFVGVEPDGRTSFPPQQVTKDYRFEWLQKLLYRPPEVLTNFVSSRTGTGDWAQWERTALMGLRQLLVRINSAKKTPTTLSPATKTMLRDTFDEEVRHLSAVIDRDLTHWLEPEATADRKRKTEVYGPSAPEPAAA